MDVVQSAIPDVLVIEPKVFGDHRGFLTELYQHDRYAACGMERHLVQDNLSRSAGGVLRGLHFQNPNPQGKLVTVLRGAILDVAVDVRVGSPTFGHHVAIELNEQNLRQVWVPRGFAHGFVVRSDSADVFYKCDALYSPADEIVLRWNAPELGIRWSCADPKLSPRDQQGRSLTQLDGMLPIYGRV